MREVSRGGRESGPSREHPGARGQGQHAVRKLALQTFHHMHRLSLRFHLQRRTGGLSRVIERGTKGIETVVRFAMLNIAPTVVEFVVVAIIFV